MAKNIVCALLFLLINGSEILAQSTTKAVYETEEYKITFPRQFEKANQTIPSSLGQLPMTLISYEPNELVNDSNFVYMMMETKYPDSTIHSDKKDLIDNFFNASIEGAIKNVNGKLIKELKGFTGKYPNRTIEIDYKDGLAIIKMKMILKESKVIFIQTITKTENYPNAFLNTFFDSFALK